MKYRQRQLSEFFCREMLYDFAAGTLDAVRTKAIKESLEEYPELETEFQFLKQGLNYSEILSQTQVSPHFLNAILLKKSFFEQVIDLLRVHKWKAATACFFLVGILLYGSFSFFKRLPYGVLWTTDLVNSSSDAIIEEVVDDTQNTTAAMQEVKQNTKAKSVIDHKSNNSSVYDN